MPEQVRLHLDRGYDCASTREKLKHRNLLAVISEKGKPAPLAATRHFWIAFSEVLIIVRRLIRGGWTHYRWEGRPRRRP
jgi:hypothetical protein